MTELDDDRHSFNLAREQIAHEQSKRESQQIIDRLVGAMHELLHHFGKPRRQEYLNESSYVSALNAVRMANEAIERARVPKRI